MSEHKELNDTQLLWANEYLSNGFNKTKASQVAYPDAERHAEIGSENYRKPHIKTYIQDRVKELLQGKEEITMKLIERWSKIAYYENEGLPEDAKYKPMEILKAGELLGKYAELFNKSEIVHKTIDKDGKEKGIDFSKMSDKELQTIVNSDNES